MKFGESRKGRRPGESYVSKFVLRVKICIASKCIFSPVYMTIFKSDLDLHLSDSDWLVRVGSPVLAELPE